MSDIAILQQLKHGNILSVMRTMQLALAVAVCSLSVLAQDKPVEPTSGGIPDPAFILRDRETVRLAGCYELQAEWQHTYISRYGEFPKRLQLTLEGSKTGAFVAKRLDSRVLASRNWRVTRNGGFEVSPSEFWITNGWFIQLSRSGLDFRGTAHYWTDTGDGRLIGVVGHKVVCRKQ